MNETIIAVSLAGLALMIGGLMWFAYWKGRKHGVKEGEDKQRKLDLFAIGTAGRADGCLTFSEFQAATSFRCNDLWHSEDDWKLDDWLLAATGELGEACNLMKKVKRGDFTMKETRDAIARELADFMIYGFHCFSSMKLNVGEMLALKFNEVSQREGWNKIVLEVD